MESIDRHKRRVAEFFESQITGIDSVINQRDSRVEIKSARGYIHEARLAIRDMDEYEYLSAIFLLSKIKSHMKIRVGFERPSDATAGKFVFHNCIVTLQQGESMEQFLVRLETLAEDIEALKNFRDHTAKL